MSSKVQANAPAIQHHRKGLGLRIAEHWQLYALLLVPILLTFIYKYIPMYGIQIAFRDYRASRGIWGSEWVGLEWFERFFTAPTCARMIKNTFLLALYSLLWSFPIQIISDRVLGLPHHLHRLGHLAGRRVGLHYLPGHPLERRHHPVRGRQGGRRVGLPAHFEHRRARPAAHGYPEPDHERRQFDEHRL